LTVLSFEWGVTISAISAGGATAGSDWKRWESSHRAPNSGQGNGFATRFADDAAVLAEHGVGAVRLGIDWTSVQPSSGRFDGESLERLREVVTAFAQHGIAVWPALHELALPGWFVDEGGFADDQARGRYWPRYVDTVAQHIGDLVGGWFPIVEPTAWAKAAYLDARHPPGRDDPEGFARTLRGLWLAWRDSWRELRGGPPVATAIDLAPVVATDGTIPARDEARRFDDLLWRVAIRALRDGELAVPGLTMMDVPDLRSSADIVGFTYHGGIGTTLDGVGPYPADAPQPWIEGLGVVLRRLAEELPDRSILVAGHGVAGTDDEFRAHLVRATADELRSARHDGVPLVGWFHTSAIDAVEGVVGLDRPSGLFDRDRNAKASALAFAEVARTTFPTVPPVPA
jgi:beta-glucosidase